MRFIIACYITLLVAVCHCGKYNGKRQKISNNDSSRGGSPESYGLVSSPSFNSPLKINESPLEKYDPKNIDHSTLRRNLGKSFDREFMSVHRPIYLNHTYSYPFKKNKKGKLTVRENEIMPQWLKQLRFRHLWLPDGTKARTSVINKKLENKLQTYLWAHTSCPIYYTWRDIGKRFWPRWVKEGSCRSGKVSCSMPPGMTCQASAFEYKKVFRWFCSNWDKQLGCRWVEAHIPFITSCTCACPKNNRN